MSYVNYTMYIQLEGEYRAQEAFQQAKVDVMGLARNMLSLGGNIASLINYMALLENANLSVALAQDRYDEAVQRSGKHSEEAARAYATLQRATAGVTRAQLGFYLGIANTTVAMIANLKTISGLIADLGLLKIATIAQSTVDAAHTAILWAKAHAVSILTFGVAALMGTTAIMAAQSASANRAVAPTVATETSGVAVKPTYMGTLQFNMQRGESFDEWWHRTGERIRAEWGASP